ncbi:MAG: endonuclease MutS2 [Candidatus Longimicrobiales bacterium M2_2A_002]
MNEHALGVLQLPSALDVVAERASSGLGAEAVRALEPVTDLEKVRAELERVDAMMVFVTRTDGWAIPAIPDIRTELKRLAKPGSLWEARTLLEGARLIRSSATTRDVLRKHLEDVEPLRPLADRLVELPARAAAVESAIDDAADVRDDASRELARIRRELRSQRSSIVEKLERYMGSLPGDYRVQNASVTIRDGRYVVPVRREGRKHVGGIVHDESATGTTLFVEPPLALELMNRVRELEIAESREVRRILEELTESLRPHAGELRGALEALIRFDSLYARARYAIHHDAAPPTVTEDTSDYEVVAGRHPLLLAGDEAVVPFALHLEPGERTLVVSGPNTGGKTVLLKAIGLLSLMTQAGIVPPVAKGTRLPVFGNVFADIGDEQSIEASLSTFSAHVANLREIVDEADAHSLVLIDEIGSGTDPTEGAALARSILVELTRRGTMTVATSHLGALKLLAGEEDGVVNASLQFDARELKPTYRLVKGVPGRSYGLAIAQRLGFRDRVLDRAREMLPQGERDVGALLSELEVKEQELADALNDAARERKAAEEARKEVDKLREELKERRAGVKRREADAERRARQQARDILMDARKDVEDAIAELRSAVEGGAGAEAFEEAARSARRRVEQAAGKQEERAPTRPDRERPSEPPPDLEEGAAVRIAATGAEGTVVEIRDGRATVETGGMRLDVRAADLEVVDEPHSPGSGRGQGSGTRTSTSTGGTWSGPGVEASHEVHLLGLRAEEVASELLPALDAAIQAGLPSLRVVHGKGQGILREVVGELLDRDPRITSYRPGGIGEGGSGVTVVELE